MYSISICINDLVASKRARRAGNGKHYITLIVANKKQTDQFGNDATIYVKQDETELQNKDHKIYLGDGKWFVFDDKPRPENCFYEISLCLEDIATNTIVAKNGKQYVSLSVADRKELDKFGHDAVVYISQTKEQRENKEVKKYCGNAKKCTYKGSTEAKTEDLAAMFSIPAAAINN